MFCCRTGSIARMCPPRHHENIFKFIYLWFRPDSQYIHDFLLIFCCSFEKPFRYIGQMRLSCNTHITCSMYGDGWCSFRCFSPPHFDTKARPKWKLIILFDTCTKCRLSCVLVVFFSSSSASLCASMFVQMCFQIFMSNLSEASTKFRYGWMINTDNIC